MPLGYLVSNLNALGNEVLIDTFELSAGDLKAYFGSPDSAKQTRG